MFFCPSRNCIEPVNIGQYALQARPLCVLIIVSAVSSQGYDEETKASVPGSDLWQQLMSFHVPSHLIKQTLLSFFCMVCVCIQCGEESVLLQLQLHQ